jgi:NADH-quinone oxidoreductase subunit G
VLSNPVISGALFDAVPFYKGLTLDVIGGRGVRWAASPQEGFTPWEPVSLSVPNAVPVPDGQLRIGRHASLWASPEVDASPSLQFLKARQIVEISPVDAEPLGIFDGDHVAVGDVVEGIARVRAAIPAGTVFLVEGTTDWPANRLDVPAAEVKRLSTNGHDPSAVAALVTPAVEGLPEALPSAALDLPPTPGTAS